MLGQSKANAITNQDRSYIRMVVYRMFEDVNDLDMSTLLSRVLQIMR